MKVDPMNNQQLINDIRTRYQAACRGQLTKIFFSSVEQHEEEHEKLMAELETSLYILYRFDRKLKNAKTLEDLVNVIGDESTSGEAS